MDTGRPRRATLRLRTAAPGSYVQQFVKQSSP